MTAPRRNHECSFTPYINFHSGNGLKTLLNADIQRYRGNYFNLTVKKR